MSVIYTPEEDVLVREPPGVGGGTTSAIWFLALWKWQVLMVASYLIARLILRAMEEWVWRS